MSEQCPKCNHTMSFIGNWPDIGNGGKVKETYVCNHCYVPGGCRQAVRRDKTIEEAPDGLR